MSQEILINVTNKESRIASVVNGVLQDLSIERNNKTGVVGNIYKGFIVKVLPGMQAAFVDIGLNRAGFIHVDEIPESHEKKIENLIKEGQDIMVQVIKEPVNKKGARLTAKISISSNFLVMMPREDHIGISNKIVDELERERLSDIVEKTRKNNYGYIVRTCAEGLENFSHDLNYLDIKWQEIEKLFKTKGRGSVIYEDLNIIFRVLRDDISDKCTRIRVDDLAIKYDIEKFTKNYMGYSCKVDFYDDEKNIFDLYNINDEIDKLLCRTVDLKSGGSIVIDQNEAMTTIDVNTGGFTGTNSLEETIYKTNLEASITIARNLRLRNIGGIIIIDFIDMDNKEHQFQVLKTLEKELSTDSVKNSISEISALGLVQLTRKRSRESLLHILCESCNTCNGRGYVKTKESVALDIFREVRRSVRIYESKSILIIASVAIIEMLQEDDFYEVQELESEIKKSIQLKPISSYTQEQFDVVLV